VGHTHSRSSYSLEKASQSPSDIFEEGLTEKYTRLSSIPSYYSQINPVPLNILRIGYLQRVRSVPFPFSSGPIIVAGGEQEERKASPHTEVGPEHCVDELQVPLWPQSEEIKDLLIQV
jgi:hypothetical protein